MKRKTVPRAILLDALRKKVAKRGLEDSEDDRPQKVARVMPATTEKVCATPCPLCRRLVFFPSSRSTSKNRLKLKQRMNLMTR